MPDPFPNLPPYLRGRVGCLDHVSQVLRDNPWGDPARRDVWIYTPPGYDAEPERRYPVVLLLPGFSGTGEGMLARGLTEMSIASRIDRLVHERDCPPFIAVLPDVMTRLGGSQFVDSRGIGAYATWLMEELRPFVDGRFRTNGRWGAAGKSSGGFGALHLAMAFPGRLGAVASHAGDMGFDLCYLSDLARGLGAIRAAGGPRGFVDAFWAADRPSGAWFSALALLCVSAAYAPPDAADEPDGFPAPLPVDWQTGEVRFDVLESWRAFDPVARADDAVSLDALRALDLLWIDAGDEDEYYLNLGARRFCRKLDAAGVPFEHDEFSGGHRGLSWRYDLSLPRLARALS